jgi:Ca-activated chloride channel family protein
MVDGPGKRCTVLLLAVLLAACDTQPEFWWQTAEQQAQALADAGKHAAAAERFSDPMRAGAEWYRAGEFSRAAAEFGRGQSPEAFFNRGNALVFQGKYEDAIKSYERALVARPAWAEAQQNLDIAAARLALLAPPEDDYGGTGGQLEADEVVFDLSNDPGNGGGTEIVDAEGGLSDDQLRELWLRRVESTPADFLAARFAYQLARREQGVRQQDAEGQTDE